MGKSILGARPPAQHGHGSCSCLRQSYDVETAEVNKHAKLTGFKAHAIELMTNRLVCWTPIESEAEQEGLKLCPARPGNPANPTRRNHSKRCSKTRKTSLECRAVHLSFGSVGQGPDSLDQFSLEAGCRSGLSGITLKSHAVQSRVPPPQRFGCSPRRRRRARG